MHQRIKTILDGILKTKRIANAYLFVGPPQSGKFEAAQNFAKTLNNTEKDQHIDIVVIEKEGLTLKIDQIRKLKEIVLYGPAQSEYLFVIVKEAETLTIEAANSFLKCLEEPPRQTVFILLSTSEEALPKTILSRCQKIVFPETEGKQASEEAKNLYDHIKKSPGALELLDLAKTLSLNEDLLNSLTLLYYNGSRPPLNFQSVRIIEGINQGIKRKGNRKIAADMLLLKLGDIWNKN